MALEVRHESWLDDEVYAALREHDAALCVADTDEIEIPIQSSFPPPRGATFAFGAPSTPSGQLAAWRHARSSDSPGSDAYVFFKHEDEGRGPQFAKAFLAFP